MSSANDNLLDAITMVSFIIGVLNFGENLTQSDKQDLVSTFNNKASELLDEIHDHLKNQDMQLKEIINQLEALKNDR